MRCASLLVIAHLVFLTAAMVSAQEDDVAEVTFPATLRVGDKVELKLIRSKKQSGADIRAVDLSLQSAVTCEVREENEAGLVLAWRTDWDDLTETLRQAPFYENNEWLKEYLEKLRKHELLIQTDELTTPIDVVNANETRDLLQEVVDGMISGMPLEADERVQVDQLLSQVMSSDVLIARMLQDASLYFMFTGGTFEIGEDYGYQGELPNPFGGEPLPADVVFRVTSMDPRTNEAVVHYEQETDPTFVRALLEDFFKQAPNGDEVIAEMENMELGILSNAVYTMNLKTGLPKHLRFERAFRMGPGTERVDVTEIHTLTVTAAK